MSWLNRLVERSSLAPRAAQFVAPRAPAVREPAAADESAPVAEEVSAPIVAARAPASATNMNFTSPESVAPRRGPEFAAPVGQRGDAPVLVAPAAPFEPPASARSAFAARGDDVDGRARGAAGPTEAASLRPAQPTTSFGAGAQRRALEEALAWVSGRAVEQATRELLGQAERAEAPAPAERASVVNHSEASRGPSPAERTAVAASAPPAAKPSELRPPAAPAISPQSTASRPRAALHVGKLVLQVSSPAPNVRAASPSKRPHKAANQAGSARAPRRSSLRFGLGVS